VADFLTAVLTSTPRIDLLPVCDGRYDDYSLRDRVRGGVARRKDRNDTFSATAARYWSCSSTSRRRC
jgi:hypothetical protein